MPGLNFELQFEKNSLNVARCRSFVKTILIWWVFGSGPIFAMKENIRGNERAQLYPIQSSFEKLF